MAGFWHLRRLRLNPAERKKASEVCPNRPRAASKLTVRYDGRAIKSTNAFVHMTLVDTP